MSTGIQDIVTNNWPPVCYDSCELETTKQFVIENYGSKSILSTAPIKRLEKHAELASFLQLFRLKLGRLTTNLLINQNEACQKKLRIVKEKYKCLNENRKWSIQI